MPSDLTSSDKNSKLKQSNLDADIAGAGGGTFLVAISQSFPPEVSTWLIYLAPAFSVVISISVKWLKKYLDQYLKIRRFKKLTKQAINFILDSLNDPLLSDERKTYLKTLYDKLNEKAEQLHFGQIDAIKLEEEYSTLFGDE